MRARPIRSDLVEEIKQIEEVDSRIEKKFGKNHVVHLEGESRNIEADYYSMMGSLKKSKFTVMHDKVHNIIEKFEMNEELGQEPITRSEL